MPRHQDTLHAPPATSMEWRISRSPVAYPDALAWMDRRVAEIRGGAGSEAVWFLEHPPLYTAGTSARPDELKDPGRFPVFASGRGGRYTYHGPGQRVAYVMLDLQRRGQDVRAFVAALEAWVIAALAAVGVESGRRAGRIGIWVATTEGDHKIAAIGVRIRRWVSYHGVAINVNPDLEHFAGIVPCGLADFGVTSLHALGLRTTMADIDQALRSTFVSAFTL